MHHIFGHTSPDTDAFASAFALAYYLNAQHINATAYRLGQPNLETRFVLDYLFTNFQAEMDGLPNELLPYLDPSQPLDTLNKGDKIGLTDHNEQAQSIANLSDFDIRYVIDHHKLNLSTPTPAEIHIRPVGCTCTILYEMFVMRGIDITPMLCMLMLSAIISDTLNLSSPTTTDDDRHALHHLMNIANLSIKDKDDYAQKMFTAKSNLSWLSAHEILLMDYKEYDIGGQTWGIAGIETLDPKQIFHRLNELSDSAKQLTKEKRLDYLMIAIVDIKNKISHLYAHDPVQNTIISQAFHTTPHDGLFTLTGIISRKKQLVPTLKHHLEKSIS
ncbi:manganese-dependent inorganic pyrophosphatase [Moraxella haemolytica]|uniref:manganese-dependent inorganic pyrophosphatase n=1 Tax=Moraxella haemolytica TaxID=2904119 RepID=UPI0025431CED|nr:manganese-dependent inorganic pyrophosphatase [Moraxella sp. ZY171148]WII94959.1 manganese-dependent inorganic pyrophosphatase [Moraxella sp. ZY171148]